MQNCKLLEWDTEFFGYNICSIRPVGLASEELGKTLLKLKEEGVKLLYCFVDPEDNMSIETITGFSGLLVDSKVTFIKDLEEGNNYELSDSVKPYQGVYPSENLIKLALESGIYSRFRLDPNFKNREFERLYTEWIVKSVKGEISDKVLVFYDDDDDERGFVTVKLHKTTGTIGLIAVDENVRGRSIGRKLMDAVLCYLHEKNINTAEVATQKANEQACRFYNAIGFRIKNIVNIYHLWII